MAVQSVRQKRRDLAGGSSVEIEIPVTAPVVLNSDSVDYYAEVDFDGD